MTKCKSEKKNLISRDKTYAYTQTTEWIYKTGRVTVEGEKKKKICGDHTG